MVESKSKLVSLEARLQEKSNKVSRLENELQDMKHQLGGGGGSKSSSSTSKSTGEKIPVPVPAIEVAHQDEQDPVLINDPAGRLYILIHCVFAVNISFWVSISLACPVFLFSHCPSSFCPVLLLLINCMLKSLQCLTRKVGWNLIMVLSIVQKM
jgi:hypothetical protein